MRVKELKRSIAPGLVAILLSAMFPVSHAMANNTSACPDVTQLQQERSTFLSIRIADLASQLPDASEGETRELEKQIRFLETRQHLLEVAHQRLGKTNLNDRKCDAIEAFILRHSSVS